MSVSALSGTSPSDGVAFERVIRARDGVGLIDLGELWRFRELFGFLAWRDILVRYKQTYLGVAWAVLQPVLTAVVFSVLFGGLAKFPSQGAPYLVLTFAAVVPWQFFANALSESSNSLVASARVISKVYFPRLIIPVSAVLCGAVDALIGLGILGGFMIWLRVPLRPELLLLPLFLLYAVVAALAVGIWFCALNVRYRDVKYIVPFITRMGMYVSPVGFTSALILERFGREAHFWYCLNPMAGVIDGFRWCVLGPAFEPDWAGVGMGAAVTVLLLLGGLRYFRAVERTFADIV